MLRNAKKSDLASLARIHLRELESDFLPSLGEKFLQLLYFSLLNSNEVSLWVSASNGKIEGFISGSTDFNKVFKKILLHNFISFSLVLAPQLLKKPSILVKTFETFFYSSKEGTNVPKAELIVICISKKFHRKGLGSQLVKVMEKDFLDTKIGGYKVTVNATNKGANKFYSSLGFKKHHSFFLYNKKINLYIKKLQ